MKFASVLNHILVNDTSKKILKFLQIVENKPFATDVSKYNQKSS